MKQILRLDALALFCVSLYLFQYISLSWWVILLLFFVPDIGIIGYVMGPKKGAYCYNLLHVQVAPIILAAVGLVFKLPLLLSLACVWWSHIHFDRMLGIGLKHTDSFNHTHLGFIKKK